MKILINFKEMPDHSESHFSSASISHFVADEIRIFMDGIKKNALEGIERARVILENMRSVLEEIDAYYKEDEKELIIKIILSHKSFPYNHFSAEIQVHAPDGFPFKKTSGEGDGLPFWQPQELADELIKLSHEFEFFCEHNDGATQAGYFIKN